MQLVFVVPVIYLLTATFIFFSIICSKTVEVNFDNKDKPTTGDIGEKMVAEALDTIADEYGGYLYNNVCFKNKDGFSSEIDHLLLTQGGLFVVETKNIVGHIRGKPADKKWSSVAGEDIITFNNPLLQNQTHIKQLRLLLGQFSPRMMSLIVFPNKNSKIKRVRSSLVYDLQSMNDVICRLSNIHRYSKEQVELYKSRIDYLLLMFGISRDGHLANIKNIFGKE